MKPYTNFLSLTRFRPSWYSRSDGSDQRYVGLAAKQKYILVQIYWQVNQIRLFHTFVRLLTMV